MTTATTGGLTLSPDELERAQRVDELFASGATGIGGLIAMLDDPSWTVRRAVVAALSSAGSGAATALCETLVSRRDSETRIAATVDALSALHGDGAGDGDIDEALTRLMSNADPAVVADIAQIFGRRHRTVASGQALAQLARHADDNVAVAAIEALGRIGGRAAVEALVQSVRSGNFFRTFPAIDVLGRSGDPRAVAPLAVLLDQPHYLSDAARALGRTGDRAAIAPLARLLRQNSLGKVRVAALALKELHQRHLERYGQTETVDVAIAAERLDSATDTSPSMVRQLWRALPDGDAQEQAAICFLLGVLGDPSSSQELTLYLNRPAPVGPAAAEALKRLGPSADAEILKGIALGDSAGKRSLLSLVSRPRATAEVVACLTDADADVRVAACEALARIGATDGVAKVFPLLSDPNPRVSFAAIATIQSLGSPQTETLALAAAASGDAAIRRAGMRILAYFGFHSALGTFLAGITDPDIKVREAALQGLPYVDDKRAVDALCSAAQDPSERMRAAAMRALGQCAAEPRVHSSLMTGLGDADPWVRYYACQSLGRLAFEPATQRVSELLTDPAGQVRVAAVEALANMKSSLALDALKSATLEEEPDIRRAALVGLGVAKDVASLPILFAAAESGDSATRLVALSAVASFQNEQVLDTLARAATDPNENVRTAAIGFLAAIPESAATVILAGLLRRATRPDNIVAALATSNAGRIAGLSTALQTADDEIAPALTSALVRIGTDNAKAALLSIMKMPNARARKAAASTLATLSTKDSLAALAHAAAHDPDADVRQICTVLLAR